jgi:hypothetical protein
MNYFNTTNLSGNTLAEYKLIAKNQEELILWLFRKHKQLTPSVAHTLLQTAAPLTSTRRAISNLKSKNMLIKTEIKQDGLYGRPEYIYKLDPNPVQQKLF